MPFLKDLKPEIKLFLIVAAFSAVIAVAGILLLQQVVLRPSSPAPFVQTSPSSQPHIINNQQVQQKELVWEERLLTDPEEEASFVGWNPDDSEILYRSDKGNNEWFYGTLAASRTRNNFSLWIVNPDGSGKRKLTTDVNSNVQYAVWSSDGRKIIYVSDEGEQVDQGGYFKEYNVWVISSDGTNKRKLTGTKLQQARQSPTWDVNPDQTKVYWSSDGKKIIVWIYATYASLGGRIPAADQIWVVNTDGTGEERKLTNEEAGQDTTWSVNTQQLMLAKYNYAGYEGTPVKIDIDRNVYQWVQNADSGKSEFESPDATKMLLVEGSLDSKGQLYMLDVVSNTKVKIESQEFPELFQEVTPLWFFDSQYVLFAIKEYGYPRTYRDGLWLIKAAGTNLQKINNRDVSSISWNHDGTKALIDSSVLVNPSGNQYSNSSVSVLEFKLEGWQTYQNEEFGFETRIGSNCYAGEHTKGVTFFNNIIIPAEDSGSGKDEVLRWNEVSIGVYSDVKDLANAEANISLGDFLTQKYGNLLDQEREKIEKKSFGIGEFDGWLVEVFKELGTTAIISTAYIQRENGEVFVIEGPTPSLTSALAEYPENSCSYDQILATFRFVE